MKNFTHDFKTACIKHDIELEFYGLAKKAFASNSASPSITIVTGPDYQRHIDNARNLLSAAKIRICEIDPLIFADIYRGVEKEKDILVSNKSIEHYGSQFIDCDLTCVSDIDVIRKTLLKQMDVMATSAGSKVFIFSYGLRNLGADETSGLRSIFGLLGDYLARINKEYKILSEQKKKKKEVKFYFRKGRIINYKCYRYNAGGGPMLTCYIEYK